MGLLSSLFGGKKKEASKPPAAPVAASTAKPAVMGKQVMPALATEPAAVMSAPGAAQVKLRLKMAALLRSGEYSQAYKAARELAEIQVKAGRRVGARLWDQQADRILAQQDATA
jgi:hypothetical protein